MELVRLWSAWEGKCGNGVDQWFLEKTQNERKGDEEWTAHWSMNQKWGHSIKKIHWPVAKA